MTLKFRINTKKEVPQREAEFRTFGGWRSVGRGVLKGSKAVGVVQGIAVFERSQTAAYGKRDKPSAYVPTSGQVSRGISDCDNDYWNNLGIDFGGPYY